MCTWRALPAPPPSLASQAQWASRAAKAAGRPHAQLKQRARTLSRSSGSYAGVPRSIPAGNPRKRATPLQQTAKSHDRKLLAHCRALTEAKVAVWPERISGASQRGLVAAMEDTTALSSIILLRLKSVICRGLRETSRGALGVGRGQGGHHGTLLHHHAQVEIGDLQGGAGTRFQGGPMPASIILLRLEVRDRQRRRYSVLAHRCTPERTACYLERGWPDALPQMPL